MLLWALTAVAAIWYLAGLCICWTVRGAVENEPLRLQAIYWLLGPFVIIPLFSSRESAPERRYRWHCFISYTTREREVQEVKPFVDAYVRALQAQGVTVCPVFYDGWYLQRESCGQADLAEKLREGIEGSAFTVAFLSPAYPQSDWCCYEWVTTEEAHARRGPPAPTHSILPLKWKDAIIDGQCLPILRTRDWLSIDIANPAAVDKAVAATLAFVREWDGSR